MVEWGVFDVLGPIMVGPSSSHTAGAVRLGNLARQVAGGDILYVDITLFGSFRDTYKGHGSDRALVGGLMGYAVDDKRIKNALEDCPFRYNFILSDEEKEHPNTVRFDILKNGGESAGFEGISLGGSAVRATHFNGKAVRFTGDYYTIISHHQDAPGVIHQVTHILAEEEVNIANMEVVRTGEGGSSMMVIECDFVPLAFDPKILKERIKEVLEVHYVKPMGGNDDDHLL